MKLQNYPDVLVLNPMIPYPLKSWSNLGKATHPASIILN